MPQITFQFGTLPSNFSGTPQQFAEAIAAGLTGIFPGGALGISGQINGSDPGSTNIGVWFNAKSGIYLYDTGSTSYIPDESQTGIGGVIPFTGPSANVPANFLVCDGSSLLRTSYPKLYARIGTKFGSADSTHFNIPNCIARLGRLGNLASILGNISSGGIGSYTIQNPGSGYKTGDNVLVVGGGGTGATASITVTDGVITGVTLTNKGSGYTSAPAITFAGGGSGAAATAILVAGVVDRIELTTGGSGYTSPTVAIAAPPSVSTATATGTLASGKLTVINLTSGGSGYSEANPPAVTIALSGGTTTTTAPLAYAIVKNGVVQAVVIANQGAGDRTTATITIAAPSAAVTATATAVKTDGQISAVTPVANGTGYTTTPDVYVGAALAIIRAS